MASPANSGKVRIDHVVTSGQFALDGQSVDVENNIWLVGDDREVLIIDAAHEAGPIIEAVGDRQVVAIVCTHGHNDHINAALDVHGFVGRVPVCLHGDDRMLWNQVYVARGPDIVFFAGVESVLPRRSAARRATGGNSRVRNCAMRVSDSLPDTRGMDS